MLLSVFTLPDPTLTKESSIDPMGLEPIWTSYGQRLFEQKITTIANDLRVFTFNLFHHYFINHLFLDETAVMQEALARYQDWRSELDVKTGLTIFLEDLVTHIFYLSSGQDRVDNVGILGMNKVRSLHNSMDEDSILLEAEKRKGLLKNQLNLGMTGRYKGPMVNMGYFDRSFAYRQEAWEPVEKLIAEWKSASELLGVLRKLVTKHLLQSGGRKHPVLTLAEIKKLSIWKPLRQLYIKTFGTQKLSAGVHRYWKNNLGLTIGAPSALMESLEEIDEPEFSYSLLCRHSLIKLSSQEPEAVKIKDILILEPFLSAVEYIFRTLAGLSNHTLNDCKEGLQKVRNSANKFSIQLLDYAHPNLPELADTFINSLEFPKWIQGIISYHTRIMNRRGGNPWLEIQQQNTIKHSYGVSLPESIQKASDYLEYEYWFHTYYFDTLRNIHRNLH